MPGPEDARDYQHYSSSAQRSSGPHSVVLRSPPVLYLKELQGPSSVRYQTGVGPELSPQSLELYYFNLRINRRMVLFRHFLLCILRFLSRHIISQSSHLSAGSAEPEIRWSLALNVLSLIFLQN